MCYLIDKSFDTCSFIHCSCDLIYIICEYLVCMWLCECVSRCMLPKIFKHQQVIRFFFFFFFSNVFFTFSLRNRDFIFNLSLWKYKRIQRSVVVFLCARRSEMSCHLSLSFISFIHLCICKYLRAAREISFVLIVLPSWNKVFIIIIILPLNLFPLPLLNYV